MFFWASVSSAFSGVSPESIIIFLKKVEHNGQSAAQEIECAYSEAIRFPNIFSTSVNKGYHCIYASNAGNERPSVAFILVMRPPYSCTWRSKATFTDGEISFVVRGSILAIIIFFLHQDYESKKLF